MEQRFFADARPTSILKRLIEPAEVAALVTYLCSARLGRNGAALRVEAALFLPCADFQPTFKDTYR